MTTVESVIKCIAERRPSLKDSTLNSYKSSLVGLHRSVFGRSAQFDLDDFGRHSSKVLDFLQEKSANNRKTRLAIVTVALEACGSKKWEDAIEEYRFNMMEDKKEAEREDGDGKLTANQEKVYKPWTFYEAIIDKMSKTLRPVLQSKDEPSREEAMKIQDLLIGSLYTRMPPRRLKDFAEMRIANIDKKVDNYVEMKPRRQAQFVFNAYKTAKVHGEQRIDIPKDILAIMKRWLSIHSGDFLLVDTKGNPMTASKLNTVLGRIFHGAGANILRHSYISYRLKGMPKLNDMRDLAESMGHTVDMQLQYKVDE